MKELKRILGISLLLFVSFLSLGFSTSYGATYEMTEQELTTLENNLTALEQNNNELRNLLRESNLDLQTAKESSIKSAEQLATLKAQLASSENQLATLKAQLATLKNESTTAKESLTIANSELKSAEESLNAYVKEQEQTQNKLRQQKTLWQIIAIALGAYAVAK